MKKPYVAYASITGALILFGSAALYYQRLGESLYRQLEQEQIRTAEIESALLQKDKHRYKTERLLEACEKNHEDMIAAAKADHACDDQDLIDQLKGETSRLDKIIAEQRELLRYQQNRNADLKARLTHHFNENPDIESTDRNQIRSEVSEKISMRLRGQMKRIEQHRAQRRLFLRELETSQMTAEELAVHQAVLTDLDAIEQLEISIAETKTSYERSILYKELRQAQQELGHLMQAERQVALRELARSSGYEGNAIDEFSDYVEYILEVTNSRRSSSGVPAPLKTFSDY